MITRRRCPARPIACVAVAVLALCLGAGEPEADAERDRQYAVLLDAKAKPDAKEAALTAMAKRKGDVVQGEDVFGRTCFACHVIDNFGAALGPDLSDAGKRLTRLEIARAIAEPNAKVDKAWFMETVTTADGDTVSGFIEKEDDKTLTLRLAAELVKKIPKNTIQHRETVRTSTMPGDALTTLTAEEFMDLIEYLAARKPEEK